MGTNLNFKSFGDEPPAEGSGNSRLSGNFNFPLPRQPSIYSLTLDEFQNSLGKEFGSLNMDELMRSIWTAEETQNMASSSSAIGGGGGGGGPVGGNKGNYLQRQGSLTLPRTLSQKTVDEVWRDMSKEFNAGKDADTPLTAQRQPTLAEITLEEFLVRAGVVKEDAQLAEKPNPGGSSGDLMQATNTNNTGFGINFQQPGHGVGLMGNHLADNSAQVPVVRSSQQQLQQSPLYPKQSAVTYAQTMGMLNSAQMDGSKMRSEVVGLANQTANGNLAQGFGLQGGAIDAATGPTSSAMAVRTGSPATLPSDGLVKRNGDTPFASSIPYVYNGGLRGRKSSNTVEKVIERRQKRMIKNRESAARSRARKQAYTTELEEEVAKLKEENEELRLKQEEIKEMHKKQILEIMKAQQHGSKKRCLRRTQTGLW